MNDFVTTLTTIRQLADDALQSESRDITIRLSDGTAEYGKFDKLKQETKRGNHGFRGPGVPAGLTTLEPIGEHVGEVQPHLHWLEGSTLIERNITPSKLRAHGKTTSSLGAHDLSLAYQSAIVDAVTGELWIPDQIIKYYKDWDKERPEPIGENYRPMVRARYKQTKAGHHHFSLIFPNEDGKNIVNPELKLVYNKRPNGWRCQTNGKTGKEAFVHGGYIPAHSPEFSEYLEQIATMPASGRAEHRGKTLPERFSFDGVEMFRNARTPRLDNWPEIPEL